MQTLKTPVGELAIYKNAAGETHATWYEPDDDLNGRAAESVSCDVVSRLTRYLAGDAVKFDDVPTPRGSDFYSRCWNECRQIPSGETISYAELATRAGSPGAARAAGQAMRNNPLPVIVPCHRVVGSDGKLHGYSGTTNDASISLKRKRWLLDLENATVAEHG